MKQYENSALGITKIKIIGLKTIQSPSKKVLLPKFCTCPRQSSASYVPASKHKYRAMLGLSRHVVRHGLLLPPLNIQFHAVLFPLFRFAHKIVRYVFVI